MSGPGGCIRSSQSDPGFPGRRHLDHRRGGRSSVDGTTKVYQYPDTTNPIMTFSGVTLGNMSLKSGYMSLQSESQPVQFRKVDLMELP